MTFRTTTRSFVAVKASTVGEFACFVSSLGERELPLFSNEKSSG
jgi:hypothetical protein